MNDMTTVIDIPAYLRRIGYEGPLEPTLETLRRLHFRHPLAIAFENLDPLLRRPVELDPAALQRKLVAGGRGGYCFEQNLLFMYILRGLGFTVSGLAARVLWRSPEEAIMPRTHMLLRVDLADGIYLADVGFGGVTLTAPLRLEAGCEQPTPHETFRLDLDGETWGMRVAIGDEWRLAYRFQLEEHFPVDYELSSYFVATHPSSLFVHSLIAARPTAEGRYTLQGALLKFHGRSGEGAPRTLASAKEVERVLREVFGINVPDSTALADALERESIL